jgi:predicted dehydrogenase
MARADVSGAAAAFRVVTVTDRKLRVVQVGVGLWGQSWAELVVRARGFALVGVVDAGAPAREWAATLGVPVFRRLEQALRSLEPDLVLLVSPPVTHRSLAEAAFAAGSHVVVEKPLAPTLQDARAIVAAARSNGRVAMVAQNYRFRRQPLALRELVRGGVLGRLRGLRIECRRDLRNAWISSHDWRGRMPHPYLLDMAVHHVDLVRAITGREIAEVDARSWPVGDGPFRHDPTVSALLTLTDGTPVAYYGTWAEPLGRETSWNGDWELVGARGRATWTGGVQDALRGTVAVEPFGERRRRAELPVLPALDRTAVLQEARRAILAGDEPESSAADNLKTLAALLAIARSTEERRPVGVEELAA